MCIPAGLSSTGPTKVGVAFLDLLVATENHDFAYFDRDFLNNLQVVFGVTYIDV